VLEAVVVGEDQYLPVPGQRRVLDGAHLVRGCGQGRLRLYVARHWPDSRFRTIVSHCYLY